MIQFGTKENHDVNPIFYPGNVEQAKQILFDCKDLNPGKSTLKNRKCEN